jgi:hypothetical protein
MIGSFLAKTDSLPGRHVTNRQIRLYMNFRRNHSPTVAAAKAGFSASAAYRFEKTPVLPHKRRSPASGVGPIRSPTFGTTRSSPF